MAKTELYFTNKALVVMFLSMVVGMTIWLGVLLLLLHTPLEDAMWSLSGCIVLMVALFPSIIYKQRFRDERSKQILDKSARNGFLFMAYLLPFIIEIEFLRPSVEIVPLLIGFLVCSLALVFLSAVYYYRK